MNEKQIRALIKIVEETDIDELEVSRWGRRVRITKNRLNRNGTADVTTSKGVDEYAVSPASAPAEAEKPATEAAATDYDEIKSPMVGTFYTAASPDTDPFISVGDSVKVGDILCIVEAMKLMNEIEAEQSGVIKEVLVENGKAVQYNQPLFLIDVG